MKNSDRSHTTGVLPPADVVQEKSGVSWNPPVVQTSPNIGENMSDGIKLTDLPPLETGCTIDMGPPMGKLYMGRACWDKFIEVFGREPTREEFLLDWYDYDFDRVKPKE